MYWPVSQPSNYLGLGARRFIHAKPCFSFLILLPSLPLSSSLPPLSASCREILQWTWPARSPSWLPRLSRGALFLSSCRRSLTSSLLFLVNTARYSQAERLTVSGSQAQRHLEPAGTEGGLWRREMVIVEKLLYIRQDAAGAFLSAWSFFHGLRICCRNAC